MASHIINCNYFPDLTVLHLYGILHFNNALQRLPIWGGLCKTDFQLFAFDAVFVYLLKTQ